MAAEDRQHEARRRSFDAVADRYADVRPTYPTAAFDLVVGAVPPPARVLEVGPGPGLATLPMAQRGYEVVGIELGANLARVARRRLAAFASVRIIRADFQAWRPPVGSFDLALAASAWHWIDPEIGYPKVMAALRGGGYLALMANHPRPGRLGSRQRTFWDATDPLYRRFAPSLVKRRGWNPTRLPDLRQQLRRAGFEDVQRHVIIWRHDFDAAAYLGLLGTFSDHLTLSDRARERLFGAIRELADGRFGGVVAREYHTVVDLARRP
jgi:SAM-dependent methyltransferase